MARLQAMAAVGLIVARARAGAIVSLASGSSKSRGLLGRRRRRLTDPALRELFDDFARDHLRGSWPRVGISGQQIGRRKIRHEVGQIASLEDLSDEPSAR